MAKDKSIIKLNVDISFEDAMKQIADVPVTDAGGDKNAPKKSKAKVTDKKLLIAPKPQKQLPPSKK